MQCRGRKEGAERSEDDVFCAYRDGRVANSGNRKEQRCLFREGFQHVGLRGKLQVIVHFVAMNLGSFL